MNGRNAESAIDLDPKSALINNKPNVDNIKRAHRKVAFYPNFQKGKVYIEIARSEGDSYCYRFEKPFLWRLSRWFAFSIELVIEEPDQSLAKHVYQNAAVDTRYELAYNDSDDFWYLERSVSAFPFLQIHILLRCSLEGLTLIRSL